LVALGRRASHPDDEGTDDALHLSRIGRHRRCRASIEGRPVAVARRTILERLVLEADRRPEILAKGNPRANPRSIQEGSSGTAARANANLQGAVTCGPRKTWRTSRPTGACPPKLTPLRLSRLRRHLLEPAAGALRRLGERREDFGACGRRDLDLDLEQ
jgi:hypothetical protein